MKEILYIFMKLYINLDYLRDLSLVYSDDEYMGVYELNVLLLMISMKHCIVYALFVVLLKID